MNALLHPSQVVLTGVRFYNHLVDVLLVGQSVGHTDGINIVWRGIIQFEVLPANAAVELLVATFLASEATVNACLDVVSGEEHHATFVLNLVVEADEVLEDTLYEFVRFIKHQQGSIHLDQLVLMVIQSSLTVNPSVLIPILWAISLTKSPLCRSSEQRM